MCSMLLFIFAQKYLLLKREPLKSRPYKGPTLHAGVCVCLKKEIIICVIKFIWYGLIGWLTGNVAKICYFIKCIFKLLLQWINLMQLKGRENGTERVPQFCLPEIPMTAHNSTCCGCSASKHLMHCSVSRVEVGKIHKVRLKSLDDASCSVSLAQWCIKAKKKKIKTVTAINRESKRKSIK